MAFSHLVRSAAAALMLGWMPQAFAAPFSYDSYSVLNNQTVRLVDPMLGLDELGGAGQITLIGGTMPGGALATWCVDINDWLLNGGSFNSLATLGGDFGKKVNALLSNASHFLSTDYDASAALQVAIWKVEYGSDLTVTAPNSITVLALANTWVGNVSGTNPVWHPDDAMQVSVLRAGGTNQDQVFLTSVPEPASAVILLGSLAGFGITRRRRSARRNPASQQRHLP